MQSPFATGDPTHGVPVGSVKCQISWPVVLLSAMALGEGVGSPFGPEYSPTYMMSASMYGEASHCLTGAFQRIWPFEEFMA